MLSAVNVSPPDTATGATLHGSALHTFGLTGPIPSCPAELLPQQYAAPAAVSPHAKKFPVPMLTNESPPPTATGVRVLTVDPLPSSPWPLSSQQNAAPLDVSAQLS